MGFDNECILNIQSLPGEYFCPVCRTLVYPNEALQTQCTHLYCKPCLAYIVATTCACPYDGYLVSEADAKPLIESNKPTAEAIEKIQVHCLYHRSGCQWQGTLSECIKHCTSCNFGNSPVVCNRCGTQIIHRQVQEHAQICPGVQPQAQQGDNSQTPAATSQNQSVIQPAAPASQEAASQVAATTLVAAATPASAAVPASVPAATVAVPVSSVQDQGQPNAAVQPQVAVQAPTTEQWYQQQYQQYYQQYPGYDPYQQHYQQYGYYQQQVPAQYPQSYAQPHPVQGQPQPQVYVQQQPQAQPQAHAQPAPQPQLQTHAYPQPVPLSQPPQMQAPANLQQPVQTHPQQPQMHPSTQSQVPVQPLGQPQPQPQTQTHQLQPQPLPQTQPPHFPPQLRPQHQQPVMAQHLPPQIQQPQLHAQYQQQPNLHAHTQQPIQQPPLHMHPQPHPRPHSLPQPQPQPQMQPQPQPQPQPQALPQPQLQPHPQGQPQPQPQLHPAPAHAVTGHQSFPQTQLHQQTPPAAATHQRPMHMHPPQGVSHQQLQHSAQMQNQFPHQQPLQAQLRPHPSQVPVQGQQQAVIPSVQGPHMHLPPGQQQGHNLVHPSSQQIHHPTGMQAPPQHLSISQQQAQGPPHHSQLHHQGPFPPQQQPLHPQQALRPQGPSFMQQHPQLQPVSQTAPRPVASTHALPQQPFGQSPGGPGIRPQGSLDQKVASVQLVHAGNQNSVLSSSPILKPGMDEKHGDSVSDKTGQEAIEMSTEKNGDVSADLKQKSENNFKQEGDEKKLPDKTEENAQSVADGKYPASLENHDISEAKPSVKEEGAGLSEHSPNRVLPDSSVECNDDEGVTAQESKEIERKSVEGDDKSVHGHGQGPDLSKKSLGTAEKAAQNIAPQVSMYGNERGNVQGLPGQQALLSALPAHDSSALPAHGRAFQPGYPDRNMPQFPPQASVPGDPRGFPPPAQMQPNVLGATTLQVPPHAPPYMQDTASQRPPAPDRMLPQHIPHPGPNQERMFQEPPPRAMPIHGQPLVPNQLRPSSHNFPENLAHQGQPPVISDPLQAKHPPGSFSTLGPHAPLGRGPTSFGPPQGSQLPGQGQMLPPSNAVAIGSRVSYVEPFAGGPMMGPPAGSFDAASAMNARGPIHLEGQLPRSHPPNPLEAEVYANKMPGLYDGRQPDHHRSMPSEHFPRGMQPGNQSNMMVMNGFPGKVPDPSLPQGPVGERFKPLPEERYKSLTEEGLRPPAEDRFRPYGLDPGRRIVDRRDFEEDLKQFPRPSDLDSEVGGKFENYLSSSRPPLDRSSHGLGLDGASRSFDRGFGPEGPPKIGGASPIPSRLMPIGHSGSHLPVGGGGSSVHPMDTMERPRSFGPHDDNLGRKGDVPPDFHRPASDVGRHHIDSHSLHPLRSPGRELPGLPPSRFGTYSMGHALGSQSRFEDFGREPHAFGERSRQHNIPPDSIGLHDKIPVLPGSGILPSHFRRSETDTLRMGEQVGSGNLPGHMRSGNLDGHDTLPSHMRGDDPLAAGSGSFRSHLRLGELSGLDNVPPHLRSRDFTRFGEPGFGSSFPMHGFPNESGGLSSGSFHGGLDPLDHPRKRKLGSIGWCRICKIDCETVEGLDLHAQTKEHQKMTMDIVLSIKQDNAKKQKLSSEEHEEANKSRKTGFEGRPSRR